jgi:hypothetical protein
MRPKTAIRIRRERRRRWGDDEDAPRCPTCHRSGQRAYAGVGIRRGHRFFVAVGSDGWYRRPWKDAAHAAHRRPIRLNWPVKVRRGGGGGRTGVMGRTWAQCPDPFHDIPMDSEPVEPRQSPAIARLMRANAPHKAKARARRHKAHQSYQRR